MLVDVLLDQLMQRGLTRHLRHLERSGKVQKAPDQNFGPISEDGRPGNFIM